MNNTLQRASFRHAIRHPWQFGLSCLGIALGVAVVVAVDLSNQSARRAFALSTETVMGRATHQIVGGDSGVPEAFYTELRVRSGFRNVAPVVEGYVTVRDAANNTETAAASGGRTFQLLGVDPFAEEPFRSYLEHQADEAGRQRNDRFGNLSALLTRPGAVLLLADTAREMGLVAGARFGLLAGGRIRDAELIGLLHTVDAFAQSALADVVIADIATAQELLDMRGRLSRIDLILPNDDQAREALLQRLRARLPPGTRLVTAGARADVALQMTRAFNLNLTMLSLLALVVGAFLIYNTMAFSVVQRRALFGTLRAIGVTRAQVFSIVLGEAFVLALAGTSLGFLLGIALAHGLVHLVTRTINDLYFIVTVREIALTPAGFVNGVLLGLGMSLVAAGVPALEATRVAPRAALSRSLIESKAHRLAPRLAMAGLGVLSASVVALLVPGGGLSIAFGALFGIVTGFSLLAPTVAVSLAHGFSWFIRRTGSLIGMLSVRSVHAHLSRTGVAIAALMVALATTVGVGIMVDSFRKSVADWLAVTLQADVYVSTVASNAPSGIGPALLDRLARVSGVSHLSKGRRIEVESPSGPVIVRAIDMAPESYRGFHFVEGKSREAWPAFDRKGAVLLTEPYAYRHGLHAGGTVTLLTARGSQRFAVAAVVRDYGSNRGAVIMSGETFRRFWNVRGYTDLGIYAADGVDAERLLIALRAAAGAEQALWMRSNQGLREVSLAIFDRTFTITLVLRLLAMFVAFVGVFSALMAMQLERAREMAVLRAQGLTAEQLWGLVGGQTGVMGLIAGLLSVPLGLAMALVLILVINRRSFGWSLDVHVDPAILGQAVVLAVAAALIAGIYPAKKMARTPPALALREE